MKTHASALGVFKRVCRSSDRRQYNLRVVVILPSKSGVNVLRLPFPLSDGHRWQVQAAATPQQDAVPVDLLVMSS